MQSQENQPKNLYDKFIKLVWTDVTNEIECVKEAKGQGKGLNQIEETKQREQIINYKPYQEIFLKPWLDKLVEIVRTCPENGRIQFMHNLPFYWREVENAKEHYLESRIPFVSLAPKIMKPRKVEYAGMETTLPGFTLPGSVLPKLLFRRTKMNAIAFPDSTISAINLILKQEFTVDQMIQNLIEKSGKIKFVAMFGGARRRKRRSYRRRNYRKRRKSHRKRKRNVVQKKNRIR